MHIALVTSEYHTESYRAGGMGQAFAKMAHLLADAGHGVSVCVPGQEAEGFCERERIRVYRYAADSTLHWRLRQAFSWRFPDSIQLYERGMALWRVLDRVDQQHPIDAVLSAASANDYLAVCCKRWPWISRCSTFWPFWIACNFESPYVGRVRGNLDTWLITQGLRASSLSIAPSQIIADVQSEWCRRRLAVVRTPMMELAEPEPWDAVATKFDLPEHYILFYGSHQGVKGPHILAAVLPEVLDKHPEMHAVFVGRDRNAPDGSGGMVAYLQRQLESYADRVHFPGIVEQREAFAMIRQASVVALPSLIDNLPNALLEAMHFGALIVGTSGSGIDELLKDGKNGIVVQRNHVDDLAYGLDRALSMAGADRNRLSAAAKATVQRECAPDTILESLVDILEDSARHHKKVSRAECNLRLRLAQSRFWRKVWLLWKFGVSSRDQTRFNKLARKYLPDYDVDNGMVKNEAGVEKS
jgi:glycosyltransferase involved in cell wall biosynthesis